MNTVLRLFSLLLVLTVTAVPAWAQGYTFNTPKGWTLEWSPDKKNKSGAPNANFTSATDQIDASLSIMQGRDVSVLSVEQLQEVVLSMAEDSVPNSVEGTPQVKMFGAANTGMYIRLTAKKTQSKYRYITFAINRKGKDLALGLMTSNDSDAALLPKFLAVFDSVEVGAAQVTSSVGSAKKNAAKTQIQTDQDVTWGAIATDSAVGSDSYYGIGGGDTRAESEQFALGYCREEGAMTCEVRIAYTQCGAYAASKTSFGAGIGATKRAAERQALEACQGKRCEIVVSDCN